MKNAIIDPKIATISVVTIPQKAAVMKSQRLNQTFESHGASVGSIVITIL